MNSSFESVKFESFKMECKIKKKDVSKGATRGPKPILALPPIPESELG
jgi:hypothetical protein